MAEIPVNYLPPAESVLVIRVPQHLPLGVSDTDFSNVTAKVESIEGGVLKEAAEVEFFTHGPYARLLGGFVYIPDMQVQRLSKAEVERASLVSFETERESKRLGSRIRHARLTG